MSAIESVKAALSSVDSIVLIVDDFEAQKVLVAWKLYKPLVKFADSPLRKKEDPISALRRLWEEVGAINTKELAKRAGGVPETRVARIFDRLRASFLVWPDGTIANDANTIVTARSKTILRALARPPEPKK